jgi:hypothetical protein
MLPEMIRDARTAVRAYGGADRRRASAILAQVYNLTQFFVAYQPSAELLWRVAERALIAAEESEDARTFGGAVWLMAEAHRESGDFEAAEAVSREGLETIEPHMEDADDDLRAMWGALCFAVAFTAARSGEEGNAWHWWERANATAKTLPTSHYDPLTSFSRPVIAAHAVTTAVELRKPGEAQRQARKAAGAAIPSQPRRGRHLIEVARAFNLGNDHGRVLETLKNAYVAAPETVRYNSYARRMILELADGPRELRSDARDLAERVGVLV